MGCRGEPCLGHGRPGRRATRTWPACAASATDLEGMRGGCNWSGRGAGRCEQSGRGVAKAWLARRCTEKECRIMGRLH